MRGRLLGGIAVFGFSALLFGSMGLTPARAQDYDDYGHHRQLRREIRWDRDRDSGYRLRDRDRDRDWDRDDFRNRRERERARAYREERRERERRHHEWEERHHRRGDDRW